MQMSLKSGLRVLLFGGCFFLAAFLYMEKLRSEETPALENATDPREADVHKTPPERNPPNELGSVMVLMYHGIGPRESAWVRTPENFKKDLRVLFEKNFRPVSLEDFVSRRMDIPKGTSPVVLTFDDASAGQFRVLKRHENGEPVIDPNSAVGILEGFHKAHPDFPLEAAFFVNGKNPFRQSEWGSFKLNYLVSKGMDVGNHTTGHQNFHRDENATPKRIQAAIGKQAAYLEGLLTEHPDYKVRTFALCFGRRPKSRSLWKYLVSGSAGGTAYENIAVLNVGSSPSFSPEDKRFNPFSIPRVRASKIKTAGTGLYDRLLFYEKNPHARFVSDGNPDIVTIPAKLLKNLDTSRLADRKVVTY